MTLRVLIVTPWFPNHPTDSTGNFVLHSAEALFKAGTAISVLVCRPWVPHFFGILRSDWIRPSLRRELFDPELNIQLVHHVSIPRGRCNELLGPLIRLAARSAILRLVHEKSIQLIHVHTELAAYGIIPIALELGVPIVITIHGINTEPRLLNTEWKRNRLRDVLLSAARVVMVGESLSRHFSSLVGSNGNFRIVPNGFRLGEVRTGAGRNRWGEVTRFVSVSNLHEGKGVDLNLRALARLDSAGICNWVYTVVGSGGQRASLEALSDHLGLGGKVAFVGQLRHDQVIDALANADVFVLPSYREAFGVAYLEAMAMGLLAIGVSGQGPSAFVKHGKTGLLVEPNDVESLYEAMKSVFDVRSGAQEMAAVGSRFVRSEFTWDRHAERLISVYREALGR